MKKNRANKVVNGKEREHYCTVHDQFNDFMEKLIYRFCEKCEKRKGGQEVSREEREDKRKQRVGELYMRPSECVMRDRPLFHPTALMSSYCTVTTLLLCGPYNHYIVSVAVCTVVFVLLQPHV